jgi:hypothetical protein
MGYKNLSHYFWVLDFHYLNTFGVKNDKQTAACRFI